MKDILSKPWRDSQAKISVEVARMVGHWLKLGYDAATITSMVKAALRSVLAETMPVCTTADDCTDVIMNAEVSGLTPRPLERR